MKHDLLTANERDCISSAGGCVDDIGSAVGVSPTSAGAGTRASGACADTAGVSSGARPDPDSCEGTTSG